MAFPDAPVTRYFASQSFADLATAMPQLVRFLINDHATITGPGWSIVQAQAGGNREVPSDPSDLDSLVSATGWPNSTLANNDWIVLQSVGGTVSASFQVYMELQTATTMNVMLMPFADFNTSESALSPPSFPTGSIGAGSGSFVSMGGFSSDATYSAVADEGMAALLFDDNTTAVDWLYVGEVDSLYNTPASGTQDPRPFVINDIPSDVEWDLGFRWNRISPANNRTALGTGHATGLNGFNDHVHNNNSDLVNGIWGILPVGVAFDDSGHDHFAGWFRNVYSVSDQMETSGTLSGSNFMHRTNGSQAQICFKWDGSTAYGSASNGVLFESPERAAGDLGFFNVSRLQPESVVRTVTIEQGGREENVDKKRLKVTYPYHRLQKKPGTLT